MAVKTLKTSGHLDQEKNLADSPVLSHVQLSVQKEFRMRMSSRSIILIFSILSFFMLTLYWFLSEIMLIENSNEFQIIHKFRTWTKKRTLDCADKTRKCSSRTDGDDVNFRLNFKQAFTRYGMIAVKTNTKGSFSTHIACASELFVTECDNAGLAGMLLMTLDHLSTCRELGGVPTVFWRNCGPVCSLNATINSWNWFFEPINPRIEEDSKKVLCFAKYFGPRVLSLHSQSSRTKHNHTFIPDLLNLSFKPRNVPGFRNSDLITRQIRYWANSLIKEYVKVDAKIQEIVDNFYDQHLFGHTVLSVHVRGTDHDTETENGRLPLLMTWIQNAKYILKSLPTPNKIFIASDNSESIKKFVSEFGKKVIFTKALRAVKYHGKEVHISNYDPYKLGAEVLIDILLMAKGDHLLHAESSVAALVSYFNPEIHTHFLELKDKKDDEDDVAKHLQFGHIGDTSVNLKDFQYGEYSESPEDLQTAFKDALQCFKMNSRYSFCPNTAKGIFLDTSKNDLREP